MARRWRSRPAACHPGQNLHPDRRLAHQDRADPLLWRGAGGRRRALCRRAGLEPGLGGKDRRAADPRFRPAGDFAGPGQRGARVRGPGAAGDHLAGRGRRRRLDRRHGGLERRPHQDHRGRAGGADAAHGARSGPPGRARPAASPPSPAPRQIGSLMFPIAQRYVAKFVLVPDEAIREAQRVLWRAPPGVAQPGGAAAFAALLSGATPSRRPTNALACWYAADGGGGILDRS